MRISWPYANPGASGDTLAQPPVNSCSAVREGPERAVILVCLVPAGLPAAGQAVPWSSENRTSHQSAKEASPVAGPRNSRCTRAQPQRHHSPHTAQQVHSLYRCLRVGQVHPGVRHDLRGGAAPLCESLSAYARQFLGVMDKPDVDSIEGLSPAISIDQKTTSHNPRSTVGTVTEIHDYLRLLFARAGTPHCPICDRPKIGRAHV